MSESTTNQTRSAPAPALLDGLRAIVGERQVVVDPDLLASHEHDLTGRFHGQASALVRPADVDDVAAVLKLCAEHGAPLVSQGGNTGLVGGAIPQAGEIVLGLRRLAGLGEVDATAAQVVVGAGATLESVQDHVRAAGLELPIDHPARGTATIGGMAATNAGGALAMRYGTMRARVAGLEAVLADGSVVARLPGLLKDNAGYDLPALIVGSEGTLAVITAVSLRLIPSARRRVTALFGLAGMEQALALLVRLRRDVPSLVAADFFEHSGLELVLAHRRLSAPFAAAHPTYLVVECAGDGEPVEELAAAVEAAAPGGDVAVADDTGGRAALWAYRELHNEAIAARGVPHKLDVSVRVRDLGRFVAEVRDRVDALDRAATTVLSGHLGDGNVHVSVLGPGPDDERVDRAVLELVRDYGGSISAEHGVGVAKSAYLSLSRSPAEIAAMRSIKTALDPAGILNPGRVLGP